MLGIAILGGLVSAGVLLALIKSRYSESRGSRVQPIDLNKR